MLTTRADLRLWRGIHAAAVLLVLGAFLFSVREILNPFLLFLLFGLLAWPFARARSYGLVMVAITLLTLVWLLATLGSLLAPFFLALGAAYVLHPWVQRVQRRGVPRGAAIGLLALPLVAVLVVTVLIGVPALGQQLGELIGRVPEALASLVRWLEGLQLRLARSDWKYLDEGAVIDRLRSLEPESVLRFLQARQAEIARHAWEAVVGAGRGLGFVLNVLGYLFLTPILTFYLLRDWDRLLATLAELIPGATRVRVTRFFRDYDRLIAGYLRGTMLSASIIGTLTAVALWAVGIPYALLLGVMAGVFNIIPYLGLVLTLIPALLVTLFTDDVALSLVKVIVVFGVVQALDGAVIGPRVVGDSVGLHPVWVILALSVAGFFFGFVGLLLAVPLAALTRLLLQVGLERYRRSRVYAEEHA